MESIKTLPAHSEPLFHLEHHLKDKICHIWVLNLSHADQKPEELDQFDRSLLRLLRLSGNSKVSWSLPSTKAGWSIKQSTKITTKKTKLYLLIKPHTSKRSAQKGLHRFLKVTGEAIVGCVGHVWLQWVDHCCTWSSLCFSPAEPLVDQQLEKSCLGMFQQKVFCQSWWIKTSQERLAFD